MASSVEICNSALTKLGARRIMSLDDNVKEAREMSALYELRRDALLRSYNWNFAMKRASLPTLTTAPTWGYDNAYQLPSDYLRMVQVDEYYSVPGLADYMNAPDLEPYKIEGQTIVTNLDAPLVIRYIYKVTNTGLFDSQFTEAFAYDLAHQACESLTGSNAKQDWLQRGKDDAILLAIRSNAIELPPQPIADDSWVLARL